jgi:integrase
MRPLVRIKKWDSQPRYKFVVIYRQGHKRVLRYFKSEGAAKAFAGEKKIELLNEGRRHGEITNGERRAILVARERGFSVEDAVEFYGKHFESLKHSTSVELAIEEFLSIREAEGKSRVHLKDLRLRLRVFSSSYGRRLVASITTREIDQWLGGLALAPQTRVNHRQVLCNFFGFACQRGYTDKNPVTSATRPKVPPQVPGILTVEQTRALLHACDPTILPAVAIGAFAGLRRSEIERLDWGKVDLVRKFIEVTAASSKTASRRLVAIENNLAAWLAPLRRSSGPVSPSAHAYGDKLRAARAAAGITTWEGNELRHSFASCHLSFYESADKTALQLGHAGSRQLFAHYRELVSRLDAERYWQIFPSEAKKVIPFAASVA